MGAVPNKKLTRARKGRRLNSLKMRPIHAAFCPRCRTAKMPHTVCRQCGFYRGRSVLGMEA